MISASRLGRPPRYISPDAFEGANKPARAIRVLPESGIGLALSPFLQFLPSPKLKDLAARTRIRIPSLQALVQPGALPVILCRCFRDSVANDFHAGSVPGVRNPVNASRRLEGEAAANRFH